MAQRGEETGLALEPDEAVRVGHEALGQDLDRDVPVEPRVERAVDLAHSSGADGTEDLVGPEAPPAGQAHGCSCVAFLPVSLASTFE
jgi:hypothetical protein